ncbi:endonuclease MutS2 [Serpentinicella alkaliphila]|uniref:Endonuclease MutS2 n=1 Tax=Serpentinicella alkaliphila TaxID=1734049 RepID=A0A4R2TBL2_9FIRM|nr:endonuclease MutS2 [Serpentinicella alkaliphila]QUH24395.1 endonuclease MutS2 [Serpentinicella alkaliphila]TCP98354.1 DNA mismatch repair protein MutS2 [Serpentinicella alkaliphila]
MNDKSLRVLEYYKIIDRLREKCVSHLGQGLVDELKPVFNVSEIKKMQQETSEAQGILIQRGNVPLSGIYDVLQLVRLTEIGSYLNPSQLLTLKQTLAVARRLKSFLKEGENTNFPILSGLISNLNQFKNIEDTIERCIISESEISDNASPILRDIRRTIINKNDSIKGKLNSIVTSPSYQKYLQDTIITIRQDRYVVPVKQEYRANVPGLVHDQSSSGATLFIEPMAIVELNNQLKELRLKEKAEIERILMEISAEIAQYGTEIKANQSILKELDFIIAKGKLALDMKGIEPEINRDKRIRIKNGRHPLINSKDVVPTNIWLGEDFNILVITGPNTGGKTVTLKTVGLLTLMAQSGLHVPADYGTKLSIFDEVFADIGDEQSIEQSLSTFSSHMTNIVNILSNVTSNSLVLFDELGAGTDPTEGAALAMSILDHLKKLGTTVIGTTHYSELKHYALVNERVENASVEFDVETLRPTYRLLIGVPGKSNAFEISSKLGLPNFIIDSARQLLTKETVEFEELLQKIERNKVESEKEKSQSERLRQEAEKLYDNYLDKKQKMDEQRDKIVREARREASQILKEAKKEAEEIITELRQLKLEQEEKEINKKIEASKLRLKAKAESLEEIIEDSLFSKKTSKPPQNLKTGEAVKVLSLNQIGYVVEPPNKNNEVLVQIGIMKMNIPLDNLLRADEEKTAQKTGVGRIVKNKADKVKSEVDVRGKNLEESMLEIDKYLDDAYIAGLQEVTLIHGVGTGVLKAGIKQMLKKHKHVKDYREGAYGEGGQGVTIVQLK